MRTEREKMLAGDLYDPLDPELDPDPAFRAWLGIDTGPIEVSLEASRWDRPVSDPNIALKSLYEWWTTERAGFVHRYEQRTYPSGEPPRRVVASLFHSPQPHAWRLRV